jgi:hypothetical protein
MNTTQCEKPTSGKPDRTERAERDLSKLVDANRLREVLWDAKSAPSKRTIWNWTRDGRIPVVRVGISVFYDPSKVKAALEKPKARVLKPRRKQATKG